MPDSYFEIMGVTILLSFGLMIVGRLISRSAERLLSQELKAKLIDLSRPLLGLPMALISFVPLGVATKLTAEDGSWKTVQLFFGIGLISQLIYSGMAVLWLRKNFANNGFPEKFIRLRTAGISLWFFAFIVLLIGLYWAFLDLYQLFSSAR